MIFDSKNREDFYFIGMSAAMFGFSYIINEIVKLRITSFLFWFCLGNIVNEMIYSNEISYLEFMCGLIGFALILFLDVYNKNLTKWTKEWLR